MSTIAEALSRPGSDWKIHEDPLPIEQIAEARELIGLPLPASLVELYHLCNVGEGALPFQPWNFVLWGIEEVVHFREQEYSREYFNQFVFIGSSGGGDYFGLDEMGRVFVMDPIAGEESNIVIAQSFDEFVMQIGVLPPDGLPIIEWPS